VKRRYDVAFSVRYSWTASCVRRRANGFLAGTVHSKLPSLPPRAKSKRRSRGRVATQLPLARRLSGRTAASREPGCRAAYVRTGVGLHTQPRACESAPGSGLQKCFRATRYQPCRSRGARRRRCLCILTRDTQAESPTAAYRREGRNPTSLLDFPKIRQSGLRNSEPLLRALWRQASCNAAVICSCERKQGTKSLRRAKSDPGQCTDCLCRSKRCLLDHRNRSGLRAFLGITITRPALYAFLCS
jgi:hypothetical protein